MPQNTRRNTHKTRKLFTHLTTLQKTDLKKMEYFFSRRSLIVPKNEHSTRKTFFQAEISYETEEVPFDQMKVFSVKNRTELKKQ